MHAPYDANSLFPAAAFLSRRSRTFASSTPQRPRARYMWLAMLSSFSRSAAFVSAATTHLSRLPMYSRLTAALARSDSSLWSEEVRDRQRRALEPVAPERADDRRRAAGGSSCAARAARSAGPMQSPSRSAPDQRSSATCRSRPACSTTCWTWSAIHATLVRTFRRRVRRVRARAGSGSARRPASPAPSPSCRAAPGRPARPGRSSSTPCGRGSACRRDARRCAAARRCRRRCRARAARRSPRRAALRGEEHAHELARLLDDARVLVDHLAQPLRGGLLGRASRDVLRVDADHEDLLLLLRLREGGGQIL